MILITLVLAIMQKSIYWVTKSKKRVFDERQLAIRRTIFEVSYKVSAFATLIFIWVLTANRPALLSDLKPYGFSPALLPMWGFVVLLFALPSLLAAWYKDA